MIKNQKNIIQTIIHAIKYAFFLNNISSDKKTVNYTFDRVIFVIIQSLIYCIYYNMYWQIDVNEGVEWIMPPCWAHDTILIWQITGLNGTRL